LNCATETALGSWSLTKRPSWPVGGLIGTVGAARGDTAAARIDTAEVHRLLALRPVPYDKLVLRFARPLAPETRYVIRVGGAVNLNGAIGDAQSVVLLTAKPPPPPKADTTHNAPRTTPP